MGVTAEQYAERSTAKQIDKPRKKHKPRHPTHSNKQTAEYHLLDPSDDGTDVPFQIANSAALKDESETVNCCTGKASTKKAKIQQPAQPMATIDCAPARQSPPCQSVKPCAANQTRNAPNRYRAGVLIAAVAQGDDRNKIRQ